MTSYEIRNKYFSKLHERSGGTLCDRLLCSFSAMLNDFQDGAMLPSERDLSAALEVNRRTLSKAMSILENRGLLERTRNGSVVRKNATWSYTLNQLHPMLFSMSQSGSQDLKVLLFENLPAQIQFWEEVAVGFKFPISLEWLPSSCAEPDEYAAFIGGGDYDLVQLNSHAVLACPELRGLLQPLPEEITHYYTDEQYRYRTFLSDNPEPSDLLLPLYFQLHPLLVNMEMARKHGIVIPEGGDWFETLESIAREAAEKLPEGSYLSSHFCGLFFFSALASKQCEEELRKNLTVLKPLTPGGDRFFLNSVLRHFDPLRESNLRLWNDGRLLTLLVSSLFTEIMEQTFSFSIRELLFPCGQNAFYSGFGLVRGSRMQSRAVQLLQYLLSPGRQQRLAELVKTVTFYRSGAENAAKKYGYSEEMMERIFDQCRNLTESEEAQQWQYGNIQYWKKERPIFDDFLKNDRSVESTVARIMKSVKTRMER